MIPWVKKYQPKKLSEVIGQKLAISKLLQFYRFFPQAKALLISGPAGCGKTAIVKALASQERAELIELNASDYRREQDIRAVLGPASRQASIFGTKKMLLIDEIDGLAGRQDRGGISAVADIIKESRFPIFITTNDAWDQKLKTLRRYCRILELEKLKPSEIFKRLKEIAEAEGVKISEQTLRRISAHSDGDLRAAINDLQAISGIGEPQAFFQRDRVEEIKSALSLIFKSFDMNAAKQLVDNLDLEAAEFHQWLDQNLPAEYSNEALKSAYDYLSESDRFLRRIQHWQHWRFLIYAFGLAAAGIQQAKIQPNPKPVRYSKPDLLKFYIRAAKLRKVRGLAQTLSPKLHASAQVLQKSVLPYLEFIEQKNKKMAQEIWEWLGV